MKIDLNEHGDPNWLSGKGKVDIDAIRRKHRAAHVLLREHVIKPVKPETRAKLEAAVAKSRAHAQAKEKDKVKAILRTFLVAIAVLDKTEPKIRDMIENDLMDIAGINRAKVQEVILAGDACAKRVSVLRRKAIKLAFRYLREKLPGGRALKIQGRTLAAWAKAIFETDKHLIDTAISIGLTGGEDNTDIPHRVIGSRRANGSDGTTEITRQHVIRLGRTMLHERKTRMGGSASE